MSASKFLFLDGCSACFKTTTCDKIVEYQQRSEEQCPRQAHVRCIYMDLSNHHPTFPEFDWARLGSEGQPDVKLLSWQIRLSMQLEALQNKGSANVMICDRSPWSSLWYAIMFSPEKDKDGKLIARSTRSVSKADWVSRIKSAIDPETLQELAKKNWLFVVPKNGHEQGCLQRQKERANGIDVQTVQYIRVQKKFFEALALVLSKPIIRLGSTTATPDETINWLQHLVSAHAYDILYELDSGDHWKDFVGHHWRAYGEGITKPTQSLDCIEWCRRSLKGDDDDDGDDWESDGDVASHITPDDEREDSIVISDEEDEKVVNPVEAESEGTDEDDVSLYSSSVPPSSQTLPPISTVVGKGKKKQGLPPPTPAKPGLMAKKIATGLTDQQAKQVSRPRLRAMVASMLDFEAKEDLDADEEEEAIRPPPPKKRAPRANLASLK